MGYILNHLNEDTVVQGVFARQTGCLDSSARALSNLLRKYSLSTKVIP